MRVINWIFFLVFLTLTFNSCKKGCTDKRARNYATAAREENGTCEYCNTFQQIGGSQSYNFFEENSSSPYYGAQIGYIFATNFQVFGRGNACKKYGIYDNGSDYSLQKFSLQSSINARCKVSFQFTVYGNGVSETIAVPFVTLEAYEQKNLEIETHVRTFDYSPRLNLENIQIVYL